MSSPKQPPSVRLEKILSNPNTDQDGEVEYSSDNFEDADEDISMSSDEDGSISWQPIPSLVPTLFTSLPVLRDLLKSTSSNVQDLTVQECLPFLAGIEALQDSPFDLNVHGVPGLNRKKHLAYLRQSLGNLSVGFVAVDAARPFMIYWALTGLHLLGGDISFYRERVISTLIPMQNRDGGFGGGPGQMSHLAASYAAVLSLAMVGGDEALESIDRKSLWEWLGHLKQRDGGFTVCVGGEEDVRGAYCAMTLVSLLNIPIDLPSSSAAKSSHDDTLITGLPEYLSRCQTYEGGISASPGAEAHGAYAFCALACLSILGDPSKTIGKYLDLPLLISWLSSRQHAPEGGFSGRTNKLIDGCYSHWVGACWPLIEAALNGPQSSEPTSEVVGSLCCREGLVRYILCCCQAKRGGLRDKPSKHPDSYHSCYVLAGLSSAQHYYYFSSETGIDPDLPLTAALHWEASEIIPTHEGKAEDTVFDEADRVKLIHPVYVVPWGVAQATRSWFSNRTVL